MSDASDLGIRHLALPLRQGFPFPSETATQPAELDYGDDDFRGEQSRLLGGDWSMTTTASAGLGKDRTLLVSRHAVPAGPDFVHSYLSRYAIDAIAFVAIGASLCSWLPVTKSIKWLSLSHSDLVTERVAFGSLDLASIGKAAVADIGEADSGSPPDVASLILYLLTSDALPYAHKLACRIQDLEEDLREENDGEKLSAASLFDLVSFLESQDELARPALAAGAGGHLVARWTADKRVVNVHFFGSGSTQCYAFVPDEHKPGRLEVLSASPSAQSLAGRLKQLDLLPWMAREG